MIRYSWHFVLICADLTNDFLGKNGPHLAAGVTYYFLFSLLPLTLAMTSVIGFLVGNTNIKDTGIVTAITTYLPVSREAVAATLQEISRAKALTGVIGILGLMWVSTTVFGAIRKGINAIWNISKPRPYFHERFIDISFTMGLGILLLAPLSITAIVGMVSGFGNNQEVADPLLLEQILTTMVTIFSPLASIFVFLILYRYLPNTKITFRDVWPGAVMAAFAFEAAKWLFLWYTSAFPPLYNVVYGPLSALIALLAWVYVSAMILFFGALVTSRYSIYLSQKVEETGRQLLTTLKKPTTIKSDKHV